jgi:hypothetical protein
MFFDERMTIEGRLEVAVWRRGRLVDRWAGSNLVLSAGKSVMAALIGGGGAGKTVDRIGFGTDGAGPFPGDTVLTGAYTKAVAAVSYPAAGQVRFDWSLGVGEGNGMTIREFGLICGDGTLFARKTRGGIEKQSDISLTGSWTITF